MTTFDPFSPNADRSIPVNTPTPVDGKVILVPYDSAWAEMFAREAAEIRRALGDKALRVDHIGSTSVPGLIAKPCIDIMLAVQDSAAEEAYVPELDAAGFVLRMRHPEWNEHRVFKSERINVNLHVWSIDSPEVLRHLRFRDWLREHDDDRDLYAAAKAQIAKEHVGTMSEYADKKDDVVRDIQTRIDAHFDTSS